MPQIIIWFIMDRLKTKEPEVRGCDLPCDVPKESAAGDLSAGDLRYPYRTHTFVWDGWLLLLERIDNADGSSKTVESFWGSDLSGTEQGAGGVGGLLAVSVDGQYYFPCSDHNGNVMATVSESGAIVAQYAYTQFGEGMSAAGPMAGLFRFRFSTKYQDEASGLYYYGYRFYDPDMGRFLSRDPIGEQGGLNLYGFAGNDPVNRWDVLGKYVWSPWPGTGPWYDTNMSEPTSPTYATIPDKGFAVIGEEVNPMAPASEILNQCGAYHVDITYNGKVIYVGVRGGEDRYNPRSSRLVEAVYHLQKRRSGSLNFGQKKLKCKCARDADIISCLSERPPNYSMNCQGDVQEATDDCCLTGFRTWASTLFWWWTPDTSTCVLKHF
ncbi:MAG: RHS repeat-associated core domain-containing protein [Kiritimatiellia bacterium]